MASASAAEASASAAPCSMIFSAWAFIALSSGGHRQPGAGGAKQQAQRRIVACTQPAGQHRRTHTPARDFHLLAIAEIQMPIDFAQREHGHAQAPQAEIANSRFPWRYQQGVL